jgi:starch-binding outer membrane protein, SusD/RagB family
VTTSILRSSRVRLGALLLLSFLAAGSTGCGNLVDVSDPTAVVEADVNNARGAELLRNAVYERLLGINDLGPYPALFSGLIADEFRFEAISPDLRTYEYLDRRTTAAFPEAADEFMYPTWQDLWGIRTAVAIEKLRAYAPPGAREAHVGEMFAVRGFAALRLAEHYCPGFPLHDVANYQVTYGPPLTTEQALERALAAFDSAARWAPADSVRVLNFARVGRGRTLLNLGRFAEAASAVADVPTDYALQTEWTGTVLYDGSWQSVADQEGGKGIDFVSAQDPRLPTVAAGTASNGQPNYLDAQSKRRWLVSGVEARLIEAEAALHTNQPQWITILNTLRTNGSQTNGTYDAGTAGVAGLAPLSDPGMPSARLDLVYRERAFWLFGTGSRLGDLRRLVRVYGRSVDDVFPSGTYWLGGAYGTGTSIPFSQQEAQLSPGVTGCASW